MTPHDYADMVMRGENGSPWIVISPLNYSLLQKAIEKAILTAVLEERNACAKVAEDHKCSNGEGYHGAECKWVIANAIHARSES